MREEQPGAGATSASRTMAQRVGRKWRLMVMATPARMMISCARVNELLMNRGHSELSGVTVAILSPLDRLRCLCLKALGPLARLLVRRREVRVVAAGCGVVACSLMATLFSPFWLLALGPVVLGVPHLVADLRYLVFCPAGPSPGFVGGLRGCRFSSRAWDFIVWRAGWWRAPPWRCSLGAQ